MNILKPQNLHFQKLENKCLIDLDEDEKINYCNFENEEYNNIKEGILFSGCLFCAMMNLWEKEESLLEMKLRMHIRSLRLNRLHTYRK